MTKKQSDILLCHFPIVGLPLAIIYSATGEFAYFPWFAMVCGVVFGCGWLIAMVYGFYRLSQQKLQTQAVIAWVIGLLWFSVISLPWLYWKHLRYDALPSRKL